MLLSKQEQLSPVWVKFQEHFQSRLQALRSQNDGDLDAFETARLRGRIATVKEMLALGVRHEPEGSADADAPDA